MTSRFATVQTARVPHSAVRCRAVDLAHRRGHFVATIGITLAAWLAILPGCSPQPPIIYGQQQYPPVSSGMSVQVFMHDSDIHRPYQVLGAVSAMDLGKYQMLGLQDAPPALKQKARSIGGNGLIIDSYQPVKSGIFSTGYSARAIRLEGA